MSIQEARPAVTPPRGPPELQHPVHEGPAHRWPAQGWLRSWRCRTPGTAGRCCWS